MQYLSPELSKKLTELTQENIAEIIQDKRYYVDSKDHGISVACGHRIKWGEDNQELKVICPAWQVEDVLRNLKKVFEKRFGKGDVSYLDFVLTISEELAWRPDTAYQKIEEYLWEILGHSRTEECTGAHCKCMQNDCANHHYNDHKK